MLRLDGGGDTLLIDADGEGAPRLVYWGAALPPGTPADGFAALATQAVPHGMLDDGERLDLFPEAGRGFTGHPALICRREGGSFITQLAPAAVEALDQGWRVRLADALAGVEVELDLRMDAETGVAAFRSRVGNTGADRLGLDWVAACALPLAHDEALLFEGRWAREFQTVRQRLSVGQLVRENRTGRTSHHSPPFAVVGEPGFGEHHGEVLGLHLAWSGDHRLVLERLRDGRLQAQAGELFGPREMTLAPGETYETPMLYAARSSRGLNGLTACLHPFVRDRVTGARLASRPRPVHFNTWEAVYFDHDLARLKSLADLAAEAGVERFVLDDGWFKGRDSDRRGLGDWTADPVKYPDGLGPLIAHVDGLGMDFGLWVEPEMANADSDLLRAHPDWVLGEPGRVQPLGRGQYLLDLTRAEVADHVFAALDALLVAHAIAYLKWDMNRDLTHVASGGRPAGHRQTLAVYALIDRLRARHPGVEIESCASGGGRGDYAMLERTDRIWSSDCNDPLERQAIQRGFSIFFPPEVMGSHVGAEQSHTTARKASLALRTLTALFGHFGVEADISAFSERERSRLAQAIALYKRFRPLLHGGRTVRQTHADPGVIATLVAGENEALVSVCQVETPAWAAPAPLRLVGLDPGRRYAVSLLNPPRRPQASMKRLAPLAGGETVTVSAEALGVVGLPLPILRAGEIAVFHLRRLAG